MRLLVVAMCDSVHTAGWLAQFEGMDVEFVLYPSTPHRRVHATIREMINKGGDRQVSIRRSDQLLALPLGVLDLFMGNRLRARRLRHLLVSQHFDAVHLLETQHAGYLFARTVENGERYTPTALSLWGSDLNWFQHVNAHHPKLRSVLAVVDHMFIECSRDIATARRFGYTGSFSSPMPASGGLSPDVTSEQGRFQALLPSKRKVVVVKGYTGFVGRARTALRVLRKLEGELRGYTIHFYSVSRLLHLELRRVARKGCLNVISHRKKSLTHTEMLQLFGSARISIAISASDGFPGSMREAACVGAFPIESCGSCVTEWSDDGRGVMVVNPDDENEIQAAITRALTDDELVNGAAIINRTLVNRVSRAQVAEMAFREYLHLTRR
jgi:hypothetical protein